MRPLLLVQERCLQGVVQDKARHDMHCKSTIATFHLQATDSMPIIIVVHCGAYVTIQSDQILAADSTSLSTLVTLCLALHLRATKFSASGVQ